MAMTKSLLSNKQDTLLTELESIKNLLGGKEADNIPLLQDTVASKTAPLQADSVQTTHTQKTHIQKTLTQEASPSIDGVLPGQRSLFLDAKMTEAKATSKIQSHTASTNTEPTNTTSTNTTSTNKEAESKPTDANSLSNNPFLPAHVRQRLQRDANNHPDEQALTSVNTSYTKQLVDQLVAHHLPKIEQELRRKLLEVAKHHNDIIKK